MSTSYQFLVTLWAFILPDPFKVLAHFAFIRLHDTLPCRSFCRSHWWGIGHCLGKVRCGRFYLCHGLVTHLLLPTRQGRAGCLRGVRFLQFSAIRIREVSRNIFIVVDVSGSLRCRISSSGIVRFELNCVIHAPHTGGGF